MSGTSPLAIQDSSYSDSPEDSLATRNFRVVEEPRELDDLEELFSSPSESDQKDRGEDAGVIRGGDLTVRYITGRITTRVTWNKDRNIDLSSEPIALPSSLDQILQSLKETQESAKRKTLGFNHHLLNMTLSMFWVMAFLGLLGVALGICIFIVGIALPFGMM